MPCINKGILQDRFMGNVQKIIPAGFILLFKNQAFQIKRFSLTFKSNSQVIEVPF
jgi:hypothetical protein